jgi:hypothetical protein
LKSPSGNLQIVWIVLLAITVCIVVAIRVRLLDVPLERDEGEYAYAGQLMLQGVPPYQLAYNMKFPGTYAAYALLMGVFGETTTGIHLGLLVVNLASVGLLFLLGRRLMNAAAGCTAAASYAVLSVSPSVQGFASHATHFVVLPVLAGLWLLLHGRERQSGGWICASGVLFGIGLLMKQPGAVFALFGLLCLFWLDTRERLGVRDRLLRSAAFAVGVVVPFAVTAFLLWRAGVFDKFWFWTFQYAREYGSQTSMAEGVKNLTFALKYVVGSEAALWALGGIGAIASAAKWKSQPHLLLLALLFAGAIAVCPGLYFRPHYFILLLPAVALLTGVAVSTATGLRFIAPALVAASLALPLLAHREFFFTLSPDAASRHVYGLNPFPESVRIGAFLRERTGPDDTIAVLGSEPQIPFYAKRRSATGHIYTYGLMEQHQYAGRMQREMVQEVEAAQPKFVVFVSIGASWLRRPESESFVHDWFNEYSVRELKPAGYVGILPDRTEYYLPYEGGSLTPTETHLTIWERIP